MSVDKFGRHQNVVSVRRETKRTCVGFRITDTGNIDVENKKICNLKEPDAAKDAVSLAYMNDQIKDLKRYTKSEMYKFMSIFRFHMEKIYNGMNKLSASKPRSSEAGKKSEWTLDTKEIASLLDKLKED